MPAYRYVPPGAGLPEEATQWERFKRRRPHKSTVTPPQEFHLNDNRNIDEEEERLLDPEIRQLAVRVIRGGIPNTPTSSVLIAAQSSLKFDQIRRGFAGTPQTRPHRKSRMKSHNPWIRTHTR